MESAQKPISREVLKHRTLVEDIEEIKDDFGPTIWRIKISQIASGFIILGDPPNLKVGEAVDITITKAFK